MNGIGSVLDDDIALDASRPTVPDRDAVHHWSDDELMAACRDEELRRRHTEGRLITVLVELERRKSYLDDGFRCLASWGRGVQRWSDLEARSRRDLTKLATSEPEIVERLLAGRIGVAQAHLLGRLASAPRVGRFVPLFLSDFLDQAAVMSYADFEQHVRNWRLLIDQDGADPARAHRDRSAVLAFSDHEFRLVVTGPAIDGVQWKALLHQLEQFEWERDWEIAVQTHGDGACPALMARTASQRRYDAFCSLLAHIGRDGSLGAVDAARAGDWVATGSSQVGQSAKTMVDPLVGVTVDLVVDARTFADGVDSLFGLEPSRRLVAPFGRDAGVCQSFDGTFVSPRDAVLAAIADKVRVVLTDDSGQVVRLSKTGRLFTGPMRDAVLATASRCTHPGCLVASIDCEIDHSVPYSRGGPTSVINANPACGHHNNWRYTSGVTVIRLADGTWATYRRDGTQIAPPD